MSSQYPANKQHTKTFTFQLMRTTGYRLCLFIIFKNRFSDAHSSNKSKLAANIAKHIASIIIRTIAYDLRTFLQHVLGTHLHNSTAISNEVTIIITLSADYHRIFRSFLHETVRYVSALPLLLRNHFAELVLLHIIWFCRFVPWQETYLVGLHETTNSCIN